MLTFSCNYKVYVNSKFVISEQGDGETRGETKSHVNVLYKKSPIKSRLQIWGRVLSKKSHYFLNNS